MEYKRSRRTGYDGRRVGGGKAGAFLLAQCGDRNFFDYHVCYDIWSEKRDRRRCVRWRGMSALAGQSLDDHVSLYLAAVSGTCVFMQETGHSMVLEYIFRLVWLLLWRAVRRRLYFYQRHPYGVCLVDRRNPI